MDRSADQLVVRQHLRHTCRLPADITVSADSPTRVTLSRSVGDGTGVIAVTVVDCSSGGLGLESCVYLPRQTRLAVRIRLADARTAEVELEATVQRAMMISRGPKYYLGLAFKGQGVPTAEVLGRILAHADAPDPSGGDQ